jgi:hypothetical protein
LRKLRLVAPFTVSEVNKLQDAVADNFGATPLDELDGLTAAGIRLDPLIDSVAHASHIDKHGSPPPSPSLGALGSRVRRCQTRALGLSLAPERGRVMHSRRRALWVPVDAHTKFSLFAGRVRRGLWIAAPCTARTR